MIRNAPSAHRKASPRKNAAFANAIAPMIKKKTASAICVFEIPVLQTACPVSVIYVAASYRLGLGGIKLTLTGSNSKRGSSASGAKYAFVVFMKLASSRSGKSGL